MTTATWKPDRRPLVWLGITGDKSDAQRSLDHRVRGSYIYCRDYLKSRLAQMKPYIRGRIVPWVWSGYRKECPYPCALWTALTPNLWRFWVEVLVPIAAANRWSIEPYVGSLAPIGWDYRIVNASLEKSEHITTKDPRGGPWLDAHFGRHVGARGYWWDLGVQDVPAMKARTAHLVERAGVEFGGGEGLPHKDGKLDHELLAEMPWCCSWRFWQQFLKPGQSVDPARTEVHVMIDTGDKVDDAGIGDLIGRGFIVGANWGDEGERVMSVANEITGAAA